MSSQTTKVSIAWPYRWTSGQRLEDFDRGQVVCRSRAERIAIELYSEIASWFGNDYSTGRKMIEAIFKMERKSTPRM